MFLQRQEVGKDGKLLTKAALTMPRDLSSSHLNQNFRLGFMQVGTVNSGTMIIIIIIKYYNNMVWCVAGSWTAAQV